MIVGWRERIGLPELGIARVTAKIDTGARTSAIHATRIEPFERAGAPWLAFHIPHDSLIHARDCVAPMVGRRRITNTSGRPEERWVIRSVLSIGRRRWRIEISLADRTRMAMPIILGRTALRRHGVLVDPGRSFLLPGPRGARPEPSPERPEP
jgi:hypothetical protein